MAEGEKEVLVVGSKVKAYIKAKDMRCAGETVDALSCRVACLLDKAIERAKGNKRSTVQAQDL